MRGEVHCVCFGRAENLTEVCQQVVMVVVIGVVVNGKGKLQLLFDIIFIFAYKTYKL